jgi:site-specific recombinase XerD
MDEYLELIGRNFSQNYLRSIQLSFKMLIRFSGDVPIAKINVKFLQQFFGSTFNRSPDAAALYLRTLKASFNKAIDWEYISDNPFKKIKLPKKQKYFPVFISEAELNTLLTNTDEDHMKEIIIVAFYSGMRLGEITNMEWSQVDFQNKIITVKNSDTFTTKSKKERMIPMCERLLNTLAERYKRVGKIPHTKYVFEKVIGIRCQNDYVSKSYKKAVLKANLNKKLKFHSLRHSFASNLVQKGASIYILKELLGHSDISVTQIYSHLQNESLINVVKLFNNTEGKVC